MAVQCGHGFASQQPSIAVRCRLWLPYPAWTLFKWLPDSLWDPLARLLHADALPPDWTHLNTPTRSHLLLHSHGLGPICKQTGHTSHSTITETCSCSTLVQLICRQITSLTRYVARGYSSHITLTSQVGLSIPSRTLRHIQSPTALLPAKMQTLSKVFIQTRQPDNTSTPDLSHGGFITRHLKSLTVST